VKDAPGAADFYYGEMEMRRLATRASKEQRADTTHRRSIREFAAGIPPGVAGEKWLLHLYWALPGYGLRASRALADFYYGEMEMRRLATRASKEQRADTTHRRSIREFAAGIRPGVAGEKWLLHLYWALSGYGLRASRALVALMALLAIATGVFATIGTTEGQAKGSLPVSVELTTGTIHYPMYDPGTIHYPMYDRSVGSAFWFSVRDGVALLRDPGPTPPLTVTGKIFDIVLRLAVPVLLGLAVLAIRGRIKR
jgi:hypothetical protein